MINASIFPSNEKSQKWHYWYKCVFDPGQWADIMRSRAIAMTNSAANLCNMKWPGRNDKLGTQAPVWPVSTLGVSFERLNICIYESKHSKN